MDKYRVGRQGKIMCAFVHACIRASRAPVYMYVRVCACVCAALCVQHCVGVAHSFRCSVAKIVFGIWQQHNYT